MKWMKANTVARADNPGSYENSGIIAMVQDGKAALFRFGHCSCNGTWDGTDFSTDPYTEWTEKVDWEGTPDELVMMALNKQDTVIMGRTIDPGDYDFPVLSAFYGKVLEWDKAGRVGCFEVSV